MKKTDFWTLSLVALLILAVSAGWPPALKIAVIANALLVLGQTAQKARQLYQEAKRHG